MGNGKDARKKRGLTMLHLDGDPVIGNRCGSLSKAF